MEDGWETRYIENDKKRDRVAQIFRDLGIDLKMSACGCCDGIYLKMTYKGEVIEGDSFNIDTAKDKQ